MKHNTFRNFIFLLTVLAAASSCEDSQDLILEQPAVSITSSNVLFGPRGGSGTIGFESEEQVTAYSEQPWCTVSVDGNIVTVTASEYTELENRYSSIILKAGEDSVRVVAQQNGIVLKADVEDSYLLSNDAADMSFDVESNGDVKVKSSASWIRCTATDGKISVTVRKNDDGHMRNGWFSFSSGNVSDTVRVAQASVEDLYGNYRLMGYDSSNSLLYIPASIAAGEGENELVVTCSTESVSWTFDAVFNPENHTVSYANGQYAGDWAVSGYTFHVFLCMLSERTSSFSWNQSMTGDATIEYDDENRCTLIDILPSSYDNGTGVTTYDSWVFAAFQNMDETTGMPKGGPAAYPAILYRPYFQSL